MARIPSDADITYAWDDHPDFEEAFQQPINEAPQFFAGLERAGQFQCSAKGRCAIISWSERFVYKAEAGGQDPDYRKIKRQLQALMKKTALQQKLKHNEILQNLEKLQRIMGRDSMIWHIFTGILMHDDFAKDWLADARAPKAGSICIDDDCTIIADYTPDLGPVRHRIGRICREFLKDYDVTFGGPRGARASLIERSEARKEWVRQVISIFKEEGGLLTISLCTDFVGYLWDALPSSCRGNVSLATVSQRDIREIVQLLSIRSNYNIDF